MNFGSESQEVAANVNVGCRRLFTLAQNHRLRRRRLRPRSVELGECRFEFLQLGIGLAFWLQGGQRVGGRSLVVSNQRVEQRLTSDVVSGLEPGILLELCGSCHGDVLLLGRIEERIELVVLAVRDGIVFVRVALSAPHRQTEPDRSRRVGSIDELLVAVLLFVGSPLFVRQRIAMKTGRDPLVERRVGQQVSRQLLDRELIEWQIAIERIDHPIPPTPRVGTRQVFLIAIAVGIACEIEPMPSPPLAKMGRSQQPIEQPVAGIGPFIDLELGRLVRTRRQSEQIERQPTKQRRPVGLGRRRESSLDQPLSDEGINRVGNRRARVGRQRSANELKRPMRGALVRRRFVSLRPVGSLIDPTAQQTDLFVGELVSLGRHQDVRVHARDVFDQQTLRTLAAHKRGATVATVERLVATVQPQTALLL